MSKSGIFDSDIYQYFRGPVVCEVAALDHMPFPFWEGAPNKIADTNSVHHSKIWRMIFSESPHALY